MCDTFVFVFFFFLNAPATTEIYTYLHTLSLHDALPIWSQRRRSPRDGPVPCREPSRLCRPTATSADPAANELSPPQLTPYPTSRMHPRRNEDLRSEEHTSELQSLMRISYAVFCLKKKKTQT